MSTPQSIALKIRAGLGLDTSDANQGLQEFARQAQSAVQQSLDQVKSPKLTPTVPPVQHPSEWQRRIEAAHGPESRMHYYTATFQLRERERAQQAQAGMRQPMSASDIAKMHLQERFGSGFSYLQNQRAIAGLIAEEKQRVHDLEAAYRALGKATDEASEKKQATLKRDLDEAKAHHAALQSVLKVGVQNEQALGTMADEATGGMFKGMTIQDALRGGLSYRALGKLSGMMSRYPMAMGAAGVAGSYLFGMNWLSDHSREALDYNVADLNTGRRTGRGSLRELTKPLTAMGYTPHQALGIADAYGMAGEATSMSRTYRAIGAVAREAGFGENPEAISSLARRATQLGIEPGKPQEQFWGLMQRTMSEGVRSGVDKAERMKALFAMMEATAANTGVISREMVAGLAGTTGLLAEGGRIFAGENGAQSYMQMMDAFVHPSTVAQEFLQINALKGAYGGRMPTAKELKLTGSMAKQYTGMPEVRQARFLQENLPNMPDVATRFTDQMSKMGGTNPEHRSLYQGALFDQKLSITKQMRMTEALAKIIDKYEGAGTSASMPNDLPYMLSAALKVRQKGGKGSRVQGEVDQLLKQYMPGTDGLSTEERIKQVQAQSEMDVSQAALSITDKYQQWMPKARSMAANIANAPIAKTLMHGWMDIPTKAGEIGRGLPSLNNWFHDLSRTQPSEEKIRQGRFQSDQGIIDAIQVVVSGEIALKGDGLPDGVKLDPNVVQDMLSQQLREQMTRKRSMTQSKPSNDHRP